MSLDKFYTRRADALTLRDRTERFLGDAVPERIVEPSVGAGAFVRTPDHIVCFDLKPEWLGAMTIDSTAPQFHTILRDQMRDMGVNDMLFIGNPPFGKKAKLALTFLNDFLNVGGLVAFVLPNSFRRWSVQRQVISNARLIADWETGDLFEPPDGTPVTVRCCFQIWSTRQADQQHPCLRKTTPPPTGHADFQMVRWNRQGNMANVFDWPWDFAVRCQGMEDYTDLLPAGQLPTDKAQYIMFKASTPTVLAKLKAMDFQSLSQQQLTARAPGFGMADLVEAYGRI